MNIIIIHTGINKGNGISYLQKTIIVKNSSVGGTEQFVKISIREIFYK